MPLTKEQQAIVNGSTLLKPKEIMKVNACAGSGKTSTCVEIANSNSNKKILYLVFNKAMQIEAKERFGDNVDPRTINSLAYEYIVNRQGKSVRQKGYVPYELKELLITHGVFRKEEKGTYGKAYDLINSLEDFCNSAISDVNTYIQTMNCNRKLSELWELISKGVIESTHTSYLKEFQIALDDKANRDILKKRYDMIILDEAQDTNPVTFNIVTKMQLPLIVVGDVNQNIYGFRKTLNVMKNIKANYEYKLTGNFRSSQHILDVANELLGKFKPEQAGMGLEMKSMIDHSKNPAIDKTARIYRTNFAMIQYISGLCEFKPEQRFHIPRGVDEVFEFLIQFTEWRTEGKASKQAYKWLNDFSSLEDLQNNYLKKMNREDKELEGIIKKVNFFSPEKVFEVYEYAKRKEKEKVDHTTEYLMTAHSAKGLEFDKVYIGNDFESLEEQRIKQKSGKMSSVEFEQEVNLAYVAYTRAKKVLIDNSQLFFYDKHKLQRGNQSNKNNEAFEVHSKDVDDVVIGSPLDSAVAKSEPKKHNSLYDNFVKENKDLMGELMELGAKVSRRKSKRASNEIER